MGLDYAFYICLERQKINDVMSSLSSMLVPEQGDIMRQLLPWQAATVDTKTSTGYGIKGFATHNGDNNHDNFYSLVLHIPLTDELRQALADTDTQDFIQGDYASIGYVDCCIYMGKNYGTLGLCAVTTSMSLLFSQSVSIQQFIIRHLAKHALFIYMDKESGIHRLLSPHPGELHSPDYEQYQWDTFSPDMEVSHYLRQLEQQQ